MANPSRVRRLIKTAIGHTAWQRAHDLKVSARKSRGRRMQRLEAEHKAREWAEKSKSLTELAKHFRTDKWGTHRYTPHYQRHLESLRDEPVRLLEIGIGGYGRHEDGGASLRMWKHFFPNGQIVGLDIEDKSFVAEERIRVYQGDQSDPGLLMRINEESGPFDIIVDDGSHRVFHVLPSFETLFPLLAENGIYVIEDAQSSYWPEWGGSEDLLSTATTMALGKRLADSLNYEEYVDENYEPSYYDKHVVAVHFYHNMIFVQKGRNEEGTNRRRALRQRYAAS
ncbi:MAG: class I SAM-dependent methyltransferase [Jatrophihabitans sp.]